VVEHADTSVEIRAARRTDAAAIFELARALATSGTPERESFERSLEIILADQQQRLLVAAGPAGVVGYLLGLVHPAFHANGNIGWTEELIVEESHRGTGVGGRLMRAFEDWAITAADARYFAVATRRADQFYRSVGYAASATYFKKIN
jgi:GNAT superfamily N-acetyltransferase